MAFNEPAPAATANPIEHADWLELKALSSGDRNSSRTDLERAIRRAGTADAFLEDDDVDIAAIESDRASAVAEAAFDEIEARESACGTDNGYPFNVEASYLEAVESAERSVYVFLLLLSRYGHLAAQEVAKGDVLLEHIAAAAIKAYFGGEASAAESMVFGAASRRKKTSFRAAIKELCSRLGEGGDISDNPAASDQKDAKLDVVAWTPFPDGRRGKVIGFGQCASGRNWRSKLTELLPDTFCKLWLRDSLHVVPSRYFFMPFTVPDRKWDIVIGSAGIVFDRCRLAATASDVPERVIDDCRRWTDVVLKEHVIQ